MAPSDVQLIQRVRADQTGEAMRALYRSYSGELYGFALNALGERGAAEEVVQEVFTRAWRHAATYDARRGSVRTWLYQIARHAIIDARRRASERPSLALHPPGESDAGEAGRPRSVSRWRAPRSVPPRRWGFHGAPTGRRLLRELRPRGRIGAPAARRRADESSAGRASRDVRLRDPCGQ